MISKFNSWLNEASDPKKPALFKVGDHVLVDCENSDVSVKAYNGWKRGWGKKVLCEIEKADGSSGKWIYFMKLLEGSLHFYNRGGRSDFFTQGEVRSKQSHLTTDGVEELESLISNAKYKKREAVNYTNEDEVSQSGIIAGIDVEETIKTKKIHYILDRRAGTGSWKIAIPESSIEKEIEVDKVKEDLIAEEISKVLGVSIENLDTNWIDYKVLRYDLKDSVTGLMFFKDQDDAKAFINDLRRLINKHTNSDLQLTMDEGRPTEVNVKQSIYRWRGGRINRSNLKDAARNLKIDLHALFDKFRGKIAGNKFNV